MANIIKTVDCPEVRYETGKTIFEEGSRSDCFYIIRSGQIEIIKNRGKPNQTLLATIPPGRVLGEIACMDDGPRTATAVAKTDVELVRVAADTLKWQLAQCPQWFGAIIRDLVERLRATDELVPSMTSMKDTQSG
jgi:CRP-like cAMP-binding protein